MIRNKRKKKIGYQKKTIKIFDTERKIYWRSKNHVAINRSINTPYILVLEYVAFDNFNRGVIIAGECCALCFALCAFFLSVHVHCISCNVCVLKLFFLIDWSKMPWLAFFCYNRVSMLFWR